MTKKRLAMTLVLLLAFLVACGSTPASTTVDEALDRKVVADGGGYNEVSVADFQTMMEEKDFLLVNVHIPFEGDIPDTDLSIPFDEVQQNLGMLPEERNSKIILYCRSDRMSSIAAEELVALGYTNIWNLDGGFSAWIQAGLPFDAN